MGERNMEDEGEGGARESGGQASFPFFPIFLSAIFFSPLPRAES